ncbi:transcriptional regulator, LysR family [Lachnospiraceae bacterium KM106-2]|nr:transcriptional regulator, LysR family [Lachnospiraceae bacterium KM106-2]
MTIRHLEIFVAVADCNSMSKAAKQLYVSQPSVSQVIQEIEGTYGVRLFERLNGKLFITDNGRKLLQSARHLVKNFQEMEQEMYQSGKKPTLSIGGTVSVGACLLSNLIEQYEQDYEEAKVTIVVNNITEIEKSLLNSTLDIAIVEGNVNSEELIVTPLHQDRLVIFATKEHPLASRKEVSIYDLDGMDLLVREEGSSARILLEQVLHQHQVTVNRKWCSTNTDTIKNGVIHGQGLGVLSELVIEEEVKQGKLVVLPVKEFHVLRSVNLVYHKKKYRSNQLNAFIATCKQWFQ